MRSVEGIKQARSELETKIDDFQKKWLSFANLKNNVDMSHSFSVLINHVAAWWAIGASKEFLYFIIKGPSLNVSKECPSWEVFQEKSRKDEEKIQKHLDEAVEKKKMGFVSRKF